MMNDTERETHLLAWTTEKCSSDGESTLTFEEGWSMIKLHGLQVLSDMLQTFLLNRNGEERKERKPLGTRGWSSLYTISYQMVNISITGGEVLYDRICKFINEYVSSSGVQETIETANLEEFIAVWQSYKIMTKWIWHLFMHLENSVIKLNEFLTLTSVALVSFLQYVYSKHKQSLTALVLSAIQKERDGELVDRTLLQEALQIYLMMGLAAKIDKAFGHDMRERLKSIDIALKLQDFKALYLADFEAPFMKETREYYCLRSAQWLTSMDIPSYINHIDGVMRAEEGRCSEYLNAATRPRLMRVLLEECIINHGDQVFEAVQDMFYAVYDNSQVEGYVMPVDKAATVQQLYRFCGQCQALEPLNAEYSLSTRLCVAFKEYVTELGGRVVEDRRAEVTRLAEEAKLNKSVVHADVADPHTIASILRIFTHIPQLVAALLNDDVFFKQATNAAFTSVVNREAGKFSVMQMLAAYCDNLLKGNMKVPDAEVDRLLQSCMGVFNHLIDKDMFADQHRLYLAKRLLAKRSVSSDSEKLALSAMKLQCGAQFTSKLEGMLYDYAGSVDTQNEYDAVFKQWRRGRAELSGIAFTNTVLTASFWPTQKTHRFTYPIELHALQQHYAGWYAKKHGKRILQWTCTLGDVSVAVYVQNRDYEVTVTLLQAVVLKVFDNHPGEMSFEQIQSLTGITEEEVLKRVLHSLACQKFKILLKATESKSITLDTFRTNGKFTNKLKKFRIPMATIDDTDGAAGARSAKAVQDERAFAVDACIVRTMKARKILAHVELQAEVLRQVTAFQPEPRMIKQRIENLIEREYLERDGADGKYYKYMP